MTPPTPDGRLAWVAAVLLVLVWGAAIRAGLGPLVLGPDASAADEALLLLPAVVAAGAILLALARRQLAPLDASWRPGDVVEGFERRSDRPAPAEKSAPSTAAAPSRAVSAPAPPPAVRPPAPRRPEAPPPAPALVGLGPAADPAWASWVLRWDAGELGSGVVVLPSGDHVLFGRDGEADIVARIDQVSWHHLELAVRHAEVHVMDLGSSNGTWLRADGGETPLPPRTPTHLGAWQTLRLAEPPALTLTLEPLAR